MDNPRAPATRTATIVEARLIAAFRAMPSCPVYSVGGRMQAAAAGRGAALAEILAWSAMLDSDPAGRLQLWTWARCQATRGSFAEVCREMGWPRSTAEVGRRRAAAAIAAQLATRPTGVEHATTSDLDSCKAAAGASAAAEDRLTSADA